MNKLLATVLLLSAMTTVVPAQAAVETHSKTETVTVERTSTLESSDQASVKPEKKQILAGNPNRKAIIAAIAVGAVATATYLYAAAYTTAYSAAIDCTKVAQAYCAGSQVAPASLEVCKAYLPTFCFFS